ncbi:hypothetical protein RHSIM_Rhsim10G0058700 [Rhododendron simsii]|uniref:Sulfotransferase domain-containing protein n=1 Tax=Rhododendron simsii TaxID=118357 RepID=A0A834GCD1_RHOSS|nr:hypothetical protein RHSIM_Rhsim10G0058700 [Rhododendron simsii]
MEIQNHDSDSSFPKVNSGGLSVFYQFQGFWFDPVHLQGTKQVLDNFKPLPTDVILASFPKTGTTWLKSLIYSIINRPSTNQLVTNNPHELVPSLELQVYGGPVANSPPHDFPSNTSSSASIFSTHIPYQILGETLNSSDCRVVYVARNPKDTLISLWHFQNSICLEQKWEPQPLEDIVSKFCEGVVVYGPYFEHVLGYHKESLERPEKFFFITYEELKSDPNIHVKRLAEFLGFPFVGEDMEEQVEEVVRSCSIETLKKHEVNNSTDVPSWSMVSYKSLFRKGQVGDHMNYLTEDMIERIDAIMSEKFHGIQSGISDFVSPLKDFLTLRGCHLVSWLWNSIHLQGTKQVLDHFKPLPNDVILASFPKTGTTWLKALLYSVINRASINQLVTNHPHELVPSLEMKVYGRPVANFPPDHFPSNTSNPKDTLISLWHFVNSIYLGQKRAPQALEDIVSRFCEGSVMFGPYFDRVLGYQKESLERPEKFFFITYEELKSGPNVHVKRLAEFLGFPLLGEDTEEQVEEVVRSCSIETLKKHELAATTPILIPLLMLRDWPSSSPLGCPFVGEDMEKQVEEVVRSYSIETLKKHEILFVPERRRRIETTTTGDQNPNLNQLTGIAACDNKNRIIPRHVLLAIRNDEELGKLRS